MPAMFQGAYNYDTVYLATKNGKPGNYHPGTTRDEKKTDTGDWFIRKAMES